MACHPIRAALCAALVFSIGGPAAAQAPASDPSAAALSRARGVQDALRRIEARYRGLGSFTVTFAQRYVSSTFGGRDDARGTIHVAPPGRMFWRYERPQGQTGGYDGTQYWLVSPADREVIVRERDAAVPDPLADLLAGKLEIAKAFAVDPAPDAGDGGRLAFDLRPREPRDDMDGARVEVEPDGTLRRIEIADPLGNRVVYELGRPRPAKPPDESLLRLVVPPGYEVSRQ